MQTLWLDKDIKYDGSRFVPLNNYLQWGVLGDSMVGWAGPCDIPVENMIDGEDVRDGSDIAAAKMLHFTLEMFQIPLSGAVVFQRLMSEILVQEISKAGKDGGRLSRRGDDLYWGENKLNISIATSSNTSSMIHYGVNITNAGTPVETCSLEDFSITDVESFAEAFMNSCRVEFLSIKRAMVKVRTF